MTATPTDTVSRALDEAAGAALWNRAGMMSPTTARARETVWHAGDLGVEGLLGMLQPPEQHRGPEDEQQVAHDGAGDRQLHDLELAADDQKAETMTSGRLAKVALRKPPIRGAQLHRQILGRLADEGRQRHDARYRRDEDEPLDTGGLGNERGGDGDERPPAH